MTKELEYIRDISYLISEFYSDKEPLTESQKESKECFLRYCDEIKKYLEQIDNSNPSVALEILYDEAKIESGWVKKHCITYAEEYEHNDRIKPYYDTIKQVLIQAEKDKVKIERLKQENAILKIQLDTFKKLAFKDKSE